MKTVKGIYYDLNESEYIIKLKNGLKLYFSSIFYKSKYAAELEDFIKYETARIKNKYKINVDMSLMLCLSLYLQIEKRGFKVFYKDKELKQELVKLCSELFE